MSFNTIASVVTFGGKLLKLTHLSSSTGCKMSLNLYLPNTNKTATATTTTTTTTTTSTSTPTSTSTSTTVRATATTTSTSTTVTATATTTSTAEFVNTHKKKIPVLFFLSGLTCTGNNCAEKGFLQHAASRKGIAIVYPDTSPRDLNIQGEDDSYDFGTGASFYLNATQPPWSTNYQMELYITKELPGKLFNDFPELDTSRISITGHSMGGHGALTLYLKNPGMYKSVSAFAPICNPINCPWGKKAFTGYFGTYEDKVEDWKMNDATELVKRWSDGSFPCLIDVGTGDEFYLQKQLLPERFAEAANMSGVDQDLVIRYQEVNYPLPIQVFSVERKLAKYHQGYDHSYYFVSSFASDHVNFAAKYLFA